MISQARYGLFLYGFRPFFLLYSLTIFSKSDLSVSAGTPFNIISSDLFSQIKTIILITPTI